MKLISLDNVCLDLSVVVVATDVCEAVGIDEAVVPLQCIFRSACWLCCCGDEAVVP